MKEGSNKRMTTERMNVHFHIMAATLATHNVHFIVQGTPSVTYKEVAVEQR